MLQNLSSLHQVFASVHNFREHLQNVFFWLATRNDLKIALLVWTKVAWSPWAGRGNGFWTIKINQSIYTKLPFWLYSNPWDFWRIIVQETTLLCQMNSFYSLFVNQEFPYRAILEFVNHFWEIIRLIITVRLSCRTILGSAFLPLLTVMSDRLFSISCGCQDVLLSMIRLMFTCHLCYTGSYCNQDSYSDLFHWLTEHVQPDLK